MKKTSLLFFIPFVFYAQNTYNANNYREDQLYVSVVLNTFINKPDGYQSVGFSYGYQMGFIRDFPINKKRNIAWAAGLGYAYDYYRNNIQLDGSEDLKYIKDTENRFTFHRIVFPVELRWRNSTAEKYNFWRIYTGFCISYLFSNKYQAEATEKITYNPKQIHNFNYGISLCAGYGTINFYAYYAINSIFEKSTKINSKKFTMNNLQMGIRFFLL